MPVPEVGVFGHVLVGVEVLVRGVVVVSVLVVVVNMVAARVGPTGGPIWGGHSWVVHINIGCQKARNVV